VTHGGPIFLAVFSPLRKLARFAMLLRIPKEARPGRTGLFWLLAPKTYLPATADAGLSLRAGRAFWERRCIGEASLPRSALEREHPPASRRPA